MVPQAQRAKKEKKKAVDGWKHAFDAAWAVSGAATCTVPMKIVLPESAGSSGGDEVRVFVERRVDDRLRAALHDAAVPCVVCRGRMR